MKSSNTAKDISTIGRCSKRRMSAVKFGATWGWGSSWVMNLLGHSSEFFWQNFMLDTLWVFLSKVNKCHQSEKNMWRAFFYSEIFCSQAWRVGYFFPVAKAGKTAEEGWFCLSPELPEVTMCSLANLYLNTHPLNYPGLQHGERNCACT